MRFQQCNYEYLAEWGLFFSNKGERQACDSLCLLLSNYHFGIGGLCFCFLNASAFLIYKIPLQSLSTMLFAMQGGKIINKDNKII